MAAGPVNKVICEAMAADPNIVLLNPSKKPPLASVRPTRGRISVPPDWSARGGLERDQSWVERADGDPEPRNGNT